MVTTGMELLLFPVFFLITVLLFSLLLRRIYRQSSFLNGNSSFLRLVSAITIFATGLILFLGYLATDRLEKNEEKRLRDEAVLKISVLRTAVEGDISKINAGASTLAGSPWVKRFFEQNSEVNLANAHSVLDRYCENFNAAAVYLLDTVGLTIASSNRSTADSFLGQSYSFRPYFREALYGKASGYFAVGVTSGKRGYYRSAPVVNDSGAVRGVVVIKSNLQKLDSLFSSVPGAFLVDQSNMVFLSSISEYRCRPLYPLHENNKADPDLKLQYGECLQEPVLVNSGHADEVIYRGKAHLTSLLPMGIPGWHLVMYSPKHSVFRYRLMGFSITATFILCVLIIISMVALNRIKDWADSIFLSEKRFETIFENAPEAIVICEVETGVVIAANPLASRILQAQSEPVLISEIFEQDQNRKHALSIPLTPETFHGVMRIKQDSGRYVSVSSTRLQFRGKVCLVSFLRDISGMIKAQNALEASEKKYRELAEFLPEGVFETDERGVFTYVNKRGFQMFNYTREDLGSLSTMDVIIPEERETCMHNLKIILSGNVQNRNEYTALDKNGRSFPVLVHCTAIRKEDQAVGMCGVIIDLTERIRIEKELQKKDKLEALGILAGGIAHDFNNILTAIWSGLSILKLHNVKDGDTVMEMENAIRRGKDLTGQLLTYSKGGAPIKEATSLEELVKETAAFITSGSPVKCAIEADDNLHTVEVDSTQISQVIQNLLINAIEAMVDGGVVSIRMQNRAEYFEQGSKNGGPFVELTITDTGSGVPESMQSRIFDPFFTTKPNGSGLGLATAYSVVKKHNGYIFFESSSAGTTFHVLLPASVKQAIGTVKRNSVIHSGKGTILVMDDEPIILTVTEKLLSHLGYSVLTARHGQEAIDCYKENLERNVCVDLVILDLTIPAGMGGKETVVRLKEIDPEVKAIVSSGYSHDPIMANYADYGFKAVITKPYNIQELSSLIQSLLVKPVAL